MLQGGQRGEAQREDPQEGGLCNSALTRPCLCQVDYGVIAGELEAYFNICGEVQQVTILCNKFSGHPKGSVQGCEEGAGHPRNCPAWVAWAGPHQPSFHPSYAYTELAESSAQAAVGLDKSIFQGRVIKVCEPHESPGHLEVGALGCMDSL